ncbi:MAG: carboxypeptidase regulatory-like domain-containing protein [Chloroflexi bacterium]|nr:carboxypeptidase regulatory-like domain-containing protein [Chloroflexota bacterium]
MRARPIVSVLMAGILGLTPGFAFAQSAPSNTPSGTDPDMVARCDMPVLDLFNPSPGDLVLPGSYMISGVAIDPQSPQGSGIDQVAFYLGAKDQNGVALGSVAPSGGQRQDDFSVSVDMPSADPGTQQQLVAYAHSSLSDKTTELSLPIVMGGSDSHPALANPFLNTINTNPGVVPSNCNGSAAVSVPNVAGGAPAGVSVPATAASDLFGTVVGNVTTCQNGAEQPASLVGVQANGTNADGMTNEDGLFQLTQIPAPGMYTISATDSGNTATRMYVPVAPGETIDIGTLELGAGATGCGDEDQDQGQGQQQDQSP